MCFEKEKFLNLCNTDIWLIEKMLFSLTTPPPIVDVKEGHIKIVITEDLSLIDKEKTINNYRANIAPALFIITQKVYAELFRLLLSNNKIAVAKRQIDVEREVASNLKSISNFSPFKNVEEFQNLWNEEYNFKTLRKARNNIVHNQYSYDGNDLLIEHNEEIILECKTEYMLRFSEKILGICKNI